MPKLSHEVKIKKENYGTFKHDSYKIVIPYKISQEMQLQDNKMVYATASEKTRTIRLHKIPLSGEQSVPIKIRHRLTKTYKNVKYYSTRITIPIAFIRELNLSENQSFDVYCTKNTIVIKPKRV